MKKIFKISATILISMVMACLILFPDRYASVALDGIKLWATAVLPSLFPFFFLTLLLTKMNALTPIIKRTDKLMTKLFRTSGISAYVFLMSILSGYPVGARLIAELYETGRIDKDEATRTSILCSTSGPMFVAGTVGSIMFGNKFFGYAIFICHILSAIICGKIFYNYGDFKKISARRIQLDKTENILYESIYSSVISILCVGGFICVFYILTVIAKDFNLLLFPEFILRNFLSFNPNANELSKGFIYGLIECTNGCMSLSLYPSVLSASLACALISFGGISIIFQSLIYLVKAEANVKIFLLSKLLQMIISFILCFSFLSICNVV